MKKLIIASILSAGFAATAMATPPAPTLPNSTSYAGVSSVSGVSGVNKMSTHGAFATSQNQTSVSGFAGGNNFVGAAGTEAQTKGSTFTAAFGSGSGYAGAEAVQSGYASITKTTGLHHGGPGATATSTVGTETGSMAEVFNSGFAMSGSKGEAKNMSFAGYLGGSTTATSLGYDKVTTFGFATYGDRVDAGGYAAQSGEAYAKGFIFTPYHPGGHDGGDDDGPGNGGCQGPGNGNCGNGHGDGGPTGWGQSHNPR